MVIETSIVGLIYFHTELIYTKNYTYVLKSYFLMLLQHFPLCGNDLGMLKNAL